MQLPRLDEIDDTPIYNTRAVVRLTQVQAPRLRAWERRYAILAPHRSSNSYRLYSERDLATIRWLRDQVEAGMTISQATSYLRRYAETGETPPAEVESVPPESLRLDYLVDQLMDAAMRLDEPQATTILRHAFALHTVEDVCLALIAPAMVAMGAAWERNQHVVVAEHFLSGVVRTQLNALWQATYQPSDGPLTLVTCAPGENHEIGALMLALFLRRRGARVAFLGQSVEPASLLRFVEEMRPAVVCLSVTLATHVPEARDLVKRLLSIPDTHIYIGGQGIAPADVADLPPQRITYMDGDAIGAVTAIKKDLVAV